MIKTSGSCNMNCKYCFEKNKIGSKFFTDHKQLKRFLESIELDSVLTAKFIGGEPLMEVENLRRAVKELKKLERTKDTRLVFGLTTNGLKMDELISLIREDILDPILVHISWDGLYSNKVRLTSFDDAYINTNVCKIFPITDKPTVRIALSTYTVDNLFESFKYLLDNGGKVLEYYYLFDYPLYLSEEFQKKVEEQLYMISELKRVYDFTYVNWVPLERGYKDMNESIKCSHLGTHLHIDADGKLFPCEQFSSDSVCQDDSFCIGSIYDGYDMESLNRFIELFSETPKCTKTCSNYHCFECPATVYYKKKSFASKFFYICKLRSIERRIFSEYRTPKGLEKTN